MKKIILILSIALLSLAANGQIKKTTWGLTVGGNIGFFTGPSGGFYGGANIGTSVRIEMNPLISIQPEIMFIFDGVYTDKGDGSLITSLPFCQFNIPVLARFHFTDWFSLDAGPHFTIRPYEMKAINLFDIGLSAGTTFTVSRTVDIRVRYLQGLLDNYNNGERIENGRSGTVLLGFGFNF